MEEFETSDDQGNEKDRTAADMISSFISHAPPGAINEVLTDVKEIVKDEQLIREQTSKTLPRYIKSQLTPAFLSTEPEIRVIISDYNDLGDGRFADPRTKQSFKYDYITGSISDLQPWQPEKSAETWRSALERDWIAYSLEHYHEGTGSVFSSIKDDIITLHACLEGHQFQPKKFWNGRWRSIWTASFNPNQDKQFQLFGTIRLHVHYYEDGNVQLVSTRSCEQVIKLTKQDKVAKDIIDAVKKFENEYQRAISENYQTMSDTTFKALRRPLPVIRSKIEWNKLKNYKIGSELKQQ